MPRDPWEDGGFTQDRAASVFLACCWWSLNLGSLHGQSHIDIIPCRRPRNEREAGWICGLNGIRGKPSHWHWIFRCNFIVVFNNLLRFPLKELASHVRTNSTAAYISVARQFIKNFFFFLVARKLVERESRNKTKMFVSTSTCRANVEVEWTNCSQWASTCFICLSSHD